MVFLSNANIHLRKPELCKEKVITFCNAAASDSCNKYSDNQSVLFMQDVIKIHNLCLSYIMN